MGTLNFSTQIDATRTAGELQALLAKHGADAVAIRYADKEPIGLSFTINTAVGMRHFDLPVRSDCLYEVLKREYRKGIIRKGYATPAQAQRTAWRVVKVWLEAQLAFIEAEMVQLDEVMLPYLRVAEGHTLYAAWQDNELRAITRGDQ
jgi:hypothetical protein